MCRDVHRRTTERLLRGEVVWMRRAVALAAGSQPHPNPRVGALVLTPAGAEIGAAFHRSPGTSHAEVLALAQAGEAAFGATVVTTLEPCAHHGRTPPCTDALIAAGIAKVVVGAMDPDRHVAGRGVARLIDAGIEVVTGVAESDVIALDPGYFFHRRSGMPRIRLKLAATLDGQIAGRDGTSQWITSPEARSATPTNFVHWRTQWSSVPAHCLPTTRDSTFVW